MLPVTTWDSFPLPFTIFSLPRDRVDSTPIRQHVAVSKSITSFNFSIRSNLNVIPEVDEPIGLMKLTDTLGETSLHTAHASSFIFAQEATVMEVRTQALEWRGALCRYVDDDIGIKKESRSSIVKELIRRKA